MRDQNRKEEKNVEFAKAPSGIVGLETSLSLGITSLVKKGCLSIMELLEKMTVNPAKLYNLDCGYIKELLLLLLLPKVKIAISFYLSQACQRESTSKEQEQNEKLNVI